jgi:hypothetical protein
MAGWRDDRIGAAHRGENPMVMARMRSGFAVIGDTQHLPGYSLLLCTRATTGSHRSESAGRCGAIQTPSAAPWSTYTANDQHGELRSAITLELERLMTATY